MQHLSFIPVQPYRHRRRSCTAVGRPSGRGVTTRRPDARARDLLQERQARRGGQLASCMIRVVGKAKVRGCDPSKKAITRCDKGYDHAFEQAEAGPSSFDSYTVVGETGGMAEWPSHTRPR